MAIWNGTIRVVIEKMGETFQEIYFVRKGSSWVEILRSGNTLRPEPALNQDGEPLRVFFTNIKRVNGHFKCSECGIDGAGERW